MILLKKDNICSTIAYHVHDRNFRLFFAIDLGSSHSFGVEGQNLEGVYWCRHLFAVFEHHVGDGFRLGEVQRAVTPDGARADQEGGNHDQ